LIEKLKTKFVKSLITKHYIYALILMCITGILFKIAINIDMFDMIISPSIMFSFYSGIFNVSIGICSSLIAWWMLFHVFVPKIIFSKGISKKKVTDSPSGYSYRIKIVNIGNRAILDVKVIVRYRVKFTESSSWYWVTLKIDGNYVPRIPKGKGGNRIIRIYPEKTESFKSKKYPNFIRGKANSETLTLEDLMDLGFKAQLVIYVFGYDEFSGSKKLYMSPLYDKSNIGTGYFKEMDNI